MSPIVAFFPCLMSTLSAVASIVARFCSKRFCFDWDISFSVFYWYFNFNFNFKFNL
jgi:hypothetical protein